MRRFTRRKTTLSADELKAARCNPLGPDVLGDTFIICLECGTRYVEFTAHLLRKHEMTCDDYRTQWSYDPHQVLMSLEQWEQRADHLRTLRRQGRIADRSPVSSTAA